MSKFVKTFTENQENQLNDFLIDHPFSTLNIFPEIIIVTGDDDFINSERILSLRNQLKDAYTRRDTYLLNIKFAENKIAEINSYPSDKAEMTIKGKVVEGNIIDENGKGSPKSQAIKEMEAQILSNQSMADQATCQISNVEEMIKSLTA